MRNCISVDWLTVHVTLPQLNYQAVTCRFFDILKAEHQTQMFKSLYHIHDKETGEEVAVLAAEPRNEMCMAANSGLLKIINKYLYQKNFSHFVQMALQDLQLNFVNVTRLDIAGDFLKFDTMLPREFVNRFAARYYLKTYKTKFRGMGESWSVDAGQLTGGYESLKFGMETSEVNYQLYNKSLEMSQKTHKPWIMEHWESHGYDGKAEVWRLEFSLHSSSKGIVIDGEVLTFKDLSIIDRMEDIYKHCFNKHFQFVKTEKTKRGNFKKQSRCAPVILFADLKMETVKIKLSHKKDAGRSAKIFTKNLQKLYQELRGQDFDMAIAGNEMLTWLIKTRNLEAWAKKKLPDIDLSDRVVDLVAKSSNARLQMEIMNNKAGDKRVFKTREQQANELQCTIDTLKAKKFELIPDGKVPFFNDLGECVGYQDMPFA